MALVLIVDDQPAVRELLTTWISRDGYQTAQAADDEAALDEMMARPADVVLCDGQSRAMSGLDGAAPKGSTGTAPRASQLEQQLRRIRAEYLDTPNLRLTPSGAQRRFGLQPFPCMEILETLLGEDFLRRTSDGLFVRSGSAQPGPAPEGHSVNDADPLRAR